MPLNFSLPQTNHRFVRTVTKLKRKYKPSGEFDKLKGRTCVRGDLLPPTHPDNNFLLLFRI